MQETNNIFIYRLLDIKPNSGKMIFLLLIPINALWLMAIGKRLLERQNKPERIFMFLAWGNIIFCSITFILYFLFVCGIDFGLTKSGIMPIIIANFSFWLGTTGILTHVTVKYDRLSAPEHFYGLIDKVDYIKRMLTFIYWPFGIWSFQKTVNQYNK